MLERYATNFNNPISSVRVNDLTRCIKITLLYDFVMERDGTEIKIMNIPLANGRLEVTNKRIKVYNSKRVIFTTSIEQIIGITPTKGRGIRIYYRTKESNPLKLDNVTYELTDAYKFTSLDLCDKIMRELINLEIIQHNINGFVYIKPHERVREVFEDVQLNNDIGLLYVTNIRIVHETDAGISMDMSFDQLLYSEFLDENTIRIIWEYNVSALDAPIFSSDLILSNFSDQEFAIVAIRDEFAELEPDDKFFGLDIYFSSTSFKETYNLALGNDEDLDYYLLCLSRLHHGHPSPEFTDAEKKLYLACRLQGYRYQWLDNMTDEELQRRIFAVRYGYLSMEIADKWANDGSGLSIKRIVDDPKDRSMESKMQNMKDKSPEVIDSIRNVNKMRAESLRYYDKRVVVMYRMWCKNNLLQDFTDEYDDEWINYLLRRLDTHQGHTPLVDSYLGHCYLKNRLKDRDINRTTIAYFTTPDHIEQKDIYNNCWHDRERRMWYVQDDNLIDVLQSISDSDQDRSESEIGRRVWGFKEDRVNMFCGFPSITYKTIYGISAIDIGTSRITGQKMRRLLTDNINYVLPILRDSDMTPEMEIRYGEMYYKADTLECTISPSGKYTGLTPQMTKFMNKRYGFADIPLNERVRQALFCIDTGLDFNGQAPLKPLTVKVPNPYPDTLYDERFEDPSVLET